MLVSNIKSGTIKNNRYPLDCMSFVFMCLLGIGFEESIFGDKTNLARYPKASLPYFQDDFYAYTKYENDSSQREKIEPNESWKRVTTWQFAKYLDDRGLYHKIYDYNFDSLRIGDILFYGNFTGEYEDRFNGIGHCCIYMGIGRFGQPIVCDCTSDNIDYPIRVHSEPINWARLHFVGYARIPVGMNIYGHNQFVLTTENILKQPVSCFSKSINRTIWLDRPIKKWDSFLIRFIFTYKNESDIGTNFPCFKIMPSNFVFARYGDNGLLPKFKVNEPFLCEMVIFLSPELYDFENDTTQQQYLTFSTYPNTINNYDVQILEVIPIISQPVISGPGVWVPSIKAENYQEAIDILYNNIFNRMDTLTDIKGIVKIAIGSADAIPFIYRIIRYKSTESKSYIINSSRAGISRETSNGATTYTTYSRTNLAPFDLLMNLY